MRDVFDRTMFLQMSNYSSDYRECVRQAVKELVPEDELREIYTIYGVDYNQYIDDVTKQYIRYRQNV